MPFLQWLSPYEINFKLFILFLASGRKFLNEQYHLSPLSQINSADDGQQLVDVFRALMPVG